MHFSSLLGIRIPQSAAWIGFCGVLLFILLNHGNATAQSDSAWTLSRCIEHAQSNSLEVRGAGLDKRSAESTLWQSKWNFAPSVDAGARYGMDLGRAIDFGSNRVSNDLHSTSFSISASMPLFTGLSRIYTVQSNRLSLEAQNARNEQIREDIALSVTQAYLQVLFQQDLLKNRREQLTVSEMQLSLGEKRAAAGSIAEGALLDLKAQQISEQQSVVEAENALNMAKINLMQLLDLRDTTNFTLESLGGDSVELPQLPALSPEELFETARTNYASMREASLHSERAKKGIRIAQSRYYPRLALSASYGSGSRHYMEKQAHEFVDPFRDQIKANASLSIGLSLSIPIFDAFSTKDGVTQARISFEKSMLNQQRVENTLFKTIQQAYADAVAAYRSYLSAEQSVASLEEAFRWAEQKFALGLINSYDYSLAKSRMMQAKTSQLQAKFEYIFKVKILDYYRGVPLNL